MSRSSWIRLMGFLVVVLGTSQGIFAQQSPQARAATDPPGGPPLLFREEWKQPPYTGELDDEKRRIRDTKEAVGNPNLELKLYGPKTGDLLVAEHEGRHDLWTVITRRQTATSFKARSLSATSAGTSWTRIS
jgi:hypothetical protein